MRRFPALLKTLAILFLAAGIASCAKPPAGGTYLSASPGPYLLGPGDVVNVTVYGDTNLSKSYVVNEQGTIAMPLLGPVKIGGMTTQSAAARITSGLANGYMRAPNVAIEVTQYRPFFIQGAVGKSGQFPYVYGMTVRAAVSTAGGYTDTADRGKATIYRTQDGQMLKAVVGLDFAIYPGDTVVIPERWL